MTNIKHFLVIKTPAKTVYQAITDPKGLAGWWTREVTAKREIGFVNEFKFDLTHHNKMKITNLQENKLVAWDCIDGDKEWIGTHLSFELAEKSGKTELLFTHADWADQTLFYASCNFNWGVYEKPERLL